MTAAIANPSQLARDGHGLRPVDSRRDMAAISRLIQRSFGNELDDSGRRMLRDMRRFGDAGWLGWLFGHFFLPPAAYPAGFVWEQAGRLVGNASLLPVAVGDRRWLVANVAVDPDFRRRGIGRAMVAACLDHARGRGAAEVVLQVGRDNRGAIRLYRGLGFEVLSVRTDWIHPGRGQAPAPSRQPVRRRRSDDIARQWHLAQALFPEGLHWPFRLSRSWFEARSGWLSWLSPAPRHWVVTDEQDQLIASLTALPRSDADGYVLALLVPTDRRGELEMTLLRHVLAELGQLGRPLSLSYPAELVDDELKQLGFRARRTLTWMGIDLKPDFRPEAAR